MTIAGLGELLAFSRPMDRGPGTDPKGRSAGGRKTGQKGRSVGPLSKQTPINAKWTFFRGTATVKPNTRYLSTGLAHSPPIHLIAGQITASTLPPGQNLRNGAKGESTSHVP